MSLPMPLTGETYLDGADGLRGHPPIALIRRSDDREKEILAVVRKVPAHQSFAVASDEADLVHFGQVQLVIHSVDECAHQ